MIYRARYVIPIDGPCIENGEVFVQGDKIAAVGTGLAAEFPEEPIKDFSKCALLPGFVNVHSHIDYTWTRNLCDGLNLWEWIDAVAFRSGRKPDPEMVLASAMLGAAELARSGVTCVGDSSFTGLAVNALDDVGLRGVVYREIFGQSMSDQYIEKCAQAFDDVERLQQNASQRIRVGISPHAVYTTSRIVFEHIACQCADLGLPIALHVAETEAELEYVLNGNGPIADWRRCMGYEPMAVGKTPVEYLADTGILSPNTCLAHCVYISDYEMELIKGSGVGVAHCARSNAFLGAGVAPALSMLDRGIEVGIGTDSAGSATSLDFFEEMRFIMMIHRALTKDAAAIASKRVLEMATIGGARALGLGDRIGTLTSGKQADIVAVNIHPHASNIDPYLAVVSSSPEDIGLSVVDGREVVRDGRPVFVDTAECRSMLRASW